MVAEYQTQEKLSLVYKQLWQCVLQVEDLSALQERNRIARDLHDSLGHALTSLNVQLQAAIKLWQINPSQAQIFLAQAQRLGAIAIKEVRQSVSTLRTDAFEEQSLEALLLSLVEDFRQSTGVSPSISVSLPTAIPQEVAITLYRIVQEALTNICKYAEATEVQIQLSATPDKVNLNVTDNGKGFKLEQNTNGFGLQGMQERVATLRGYFHIKTKPNAGCQIFTELPLVKPQYEEQEPLEGCDTIPAVTQVDSLPGLACSKEQYSCLEQLLIALVGPIAPTLLQEFSVQELSPKELVENLMPHLPENQHSEFEQKAMSLLQASTVQSQTRKLKFEEQPECSDSIIPTMVQVDSQHLVISEEQYSHLEQLLIEFIGPIAPTLLQEVSVQEFSFKELVENLMLHLPGQQRSEFEIKALMLMPESTVRSPIEQPKFEEQSEGYDAITLSMTQVDSQHLAISEEQYSRLEQLLIEFIGPIAPTLLQEVSVQELSPKQLVENLTLHLLENQRSEFEQKAILLLQASTVQSQVKSIHSPSLKNTTIHKSFLSLYG